MYGFSRQLDTNFLRSSRKDFDNIFSRVCRPSKVSLSLHAVSTCSGRKLISKLDLCKFNGSNGQIVTEYCQYSVLITIFCYDLTIGTMKLSGI